MKILINTHQLELLASKFVIVEEGLNTKGTNLVTESLKEYKVRILFNGWISEIRIGASSSGSALAIAKLMFPKALVTGSIKQV
jgi:hypothetical protein